MVGQRSLVSLLGSARSGVYLTAAAGDAARAGELYMWSTQVSGALHAQLSYVEIAVRNAIDPVLASWNAAQPGLGRDWTDEHGAAAPLYGLLKDALSVARKNAVKESQRRPHNHGRHNAPVTHDDMIAQLMFGSWVKLVHSTDGSPRQAQLWSHAIHRAFPNVQGSDAERIRLGRQLETMRRLRNRVAHHDNLLQVNIRARLNESLSLLAKIDQDFPTIAAGRSTLRRLSKSDPRLDW